MYYLCFWEWCPKEYRSTRSFNLIQTYQHNTGDINKVLPGRKISSHSRCDILSKHSPMHDFVERLFSFKPWSLVFALARKPLKWVRQSLPHPSWCHVYISIVSDRPVPFYLFIFNYITYWCLQNKVCRWQKEDLCCLGNKKPAW